MSFGKEFYHRQLIVCPVLLEFMGGWKFAAWYLESDFIASKPNVVVVLHASGKRIPCGSVGDSVLERWCACWVLTCDAPWHLCVIAGIHQWEMSEDVIIGCQGRCWCKRLEHWTQGTCLIGKEEKISIYYPHMNDSPQKARFDAFKDMENFELQPVTTSILTGACRCRSTQPYRFV